MSTKRPSVVVASDIIQKYLGSDFDKILALANLVPQLEELLGKSDDLDESIEKVDAIIIEDNNYISDPLLDYPVDFSAEGFSETTLGALLSAFALLTKLNEQDLAELKTGTGTIIIEDNATQLAALAYVAPTAINLPNDGFGAGTSSAYSPVNKEIIYDFGNQEFDFSLFDLGDIVTLRVDIDIATSVADQIVNLNLALAEGSPSAKAINVESKYYQNASANTLTKEVTFVLDSQDMLDNPGHIQFQSDDDVSIVVNTFEAFINTKITTA